MVTNSATVEHLRLTLLRYFFVRFVNLLVIEQDLSSFVSRHRSRSLEECSERKVRFQCHFIEIISDGMEKSNETTATVQFFDLFNGPNRLIGRRLRCVRTRRGPVVGIEKDEREYALVRRVIFVD